MILFCATTLFYNLVQKQKYGHQNKLCVITNLFCIITDNNITVFGFWTLSWIIFMLECKTKSIKHKLKCFLKHFCFTKIWNSNMLAKFYAFICTTKKINKKIFINFAQTNKHVNLFSKSFNCVFNILSKMSLK